MCKEKLVRASCSRLIGAEKKKGENAKMKRALSLLLAGVLVLGMLAGCGGTNNGGNNSAQTTTNNTTNNSATDSTQTEAGEPVYGGTLRVAVNRSIKATGLDPVLGDSPACDQVEQQYSDTLIQLSPDGSEYLPCIATDWEISEDGMTYTFTLRDDVYFQPGEFQDGRLLTAEDAAYCINRSHEEAWWSWAPYLDYAEAIDDTTLVCHLQYANALFLYDLTSSAAIMIPKEEVEGWGDEFGSHPVGTGPFMVVEHVPDQYTRLVKNPNYWGVEPYLDEIIYYIIIDEAQNMNALAAGEIDVSLNIAGDYINQVANDENLVLAMGPQNRIAFCGFNMNDPILSDDRVREALTIAVDYKALADGVYINGDGSACALPIPLTSWAYDEELEAELAPVYDPERAKELLAEAGYPDGFDIVLSVGQSDAYIRAATIIQSMLSQIGVNMEIQSIAAAEMTDRLLNNNVQLFMRDGGQGGSTDPASFVGNFLDSAMLNTNYNSWCYSDPDTDALIRQANGEPDQNKRIELYHELIKIAMDAHIGIFYATINTSWGMQPNVHGYVLETGTVMRVCGLEGTGINIWLSEE